jgi:hypothetical protein
MYSELYLLDGPDSHHQEARPSQGDDRRYQERQVELARAIDDRAAARADSS